MQQTKIVLALSLALGAGLAHAQSTEYGTGAAATGIGATAIGINALAGTTYSGGTPVLLVAPATPYVNQVSVGMMALSWGYGDVATQDNTVAVGGRRIVGLSDGTAATDAVTVQQLQAAIAGVGGVDPGAIINQANAYTDQAINGLRKEYSRAIAAVAASPALPALAPGERAIAVGTGYYNGQGGLGIAFAQALQSGAIINAGVSGGSGGKPVVRAGAAWKF